MLSHDKIKFTTRADEDGPSVIFARVKTETHCKILEKDQANSKVIKLAEQRLSQWIWNELYGELLDPLVELMYLARWAANSNPSAYPKAARIEELTEKINELLDWGKQMAEKEKGETK